MSDMEMARDTKTIESCMINNDGIKLAQWLQEGLDPNFEGGWPIRLAARHGSFSVVRILLQHGANPHLLEESGASTLQLAVYSRKHWDNDEWTFLLSFCDSSQLADGAAVAIIFKNIPALKKIINTGRLNKNLPTTLTGKTVEQLAKGYKLQNLLYPQPEVSIRNVTPTCSPRNGQSRMSSRTLTPQPHSSQRTLSPSVADFFLQVSQSPSRAPVASPRRQWQTLG